MTRGLAEPIESAHTAAARSMIPAEELQARFTDVEQANG
jgi:hypothetical protein